MLWTSISLMHVVQGRSRELSASELLEAGPGKRYPKLLLLLSVLLVFSMLAWLPSIPEKEKVN